MTYQEIAPYLSAFTIIIRDRHYNQVGPEEAKHRLIVKIEAGKVRPDELYIMVT